MSDEKTEETDEGGDIIEGIRAALKDVVLGTQSEAHKEMREGLDMIRKELGAERSRKPPVPKKEETEEKSRGSWVEAETIRGIADGRERQYARSRSKVSGDELEELKACRNPGMDAMAQEWVKAVDRADVGARIRIYHEMNDEYLASKGLSRASLLEGSPTGENPLSDGSGAELLPLPLANQLIVERDKASKLRSLVNVFPMNAQVMRIPVLPTATADTRAENAAYTDNTPTADAALLTATDLGVMFSAGRNFIEDSAFNIANQLTVVAGGAIGKAEDVQMCTSTGSGADITEGARRGDDHGSGGGHSELDRLRRYRGAVLRAPRGVPERRCVAGYVDHPAGCRQHPRRERSADPAQRCRGSASHRRLRSAGSRHDPRAQRLRCAPGR